MGLRNILTVALLAVILISACEKEGGENETKISSYHSDDSHHMGENCMSCHISGGAGEGWFTVAGTVYDESKTTTYPNATIRLYTGPGGTGDLRATVEVDKLGNFYTTEKVDFGSGLYALAEGDLEIKSMGSVLTNGKCNSCHGISTDPIWTR